MLRTGLTNRGVCGPRRAAAGACMTAAAAGGCARSTHEPPPAAMGVLRMTSRALQQGAG
jgi:hypothetical protein